MAHLLLKGHAPFYGCHIWEEITPEDAVAACQSPEDMHSWLDELQLVRCSENRPP